jgi:hypothetical protein
MSVSSGKSAILAALLAACTFFSSSREGGRNNNNASLTRVLSVARERKTEKVKNRHLFKLRFRISSMDAPS